MDAAVFVHPRHTFGALEVWRECGCAPLYGLFTPQTGRFTAGKSLRNAIPLNLAPQRPVIFSERGGPLWGGEAQLVGFG